MKRDGDGSKGADVGAVRQQLNVPYLFLSCYTNTAKVEIMENSNSAQPLIALGKTTFGSKFWMEIKLLGDFFFDGISFSGTAGVRIGVKSLV